MMAPEKLDVLISCIPDSRYKTLLVEEIDRLRVIEKAAINMCDVKGNHHSELAMDRLMGVCGRVKK